jgi:pyruvate dehydrogenase E2 component (dihydrolipoamide acetyltransferase)
MDEGILLEWLVKPGDRVRRGDVVAVVDTDKAAVEVECFDDGVIERLVVPAGQRVPVGTVLAAIGAGPVASGAEPVSMPVTLPPVSSPLVTSPLVRRLAQERGVDLSAIPAGEPGAVIHRADLERAASAGVTAGRAARPPGNARIELPARRAGVRASPMARRFAASSGVDLATVIGTGAGGAIGIEDVRRASSTAETGAMGQKASRPRAPGEHPATDTHADAMRRAIAALMARSNREIPHYYLTTTIDMSAATAWLRSCNRELPVSERLVPAVLLLAATARAARDVTQLNGTWADDAFHPSPTVDLGLVVSLRRGGINVPVVTDAAERPVAQLMAAMKDLVERTRAGRLRSSELSPPSITVSNLGDQGVESVLGVIYPPQVALVGFGVVVERPWAVDGMLGVRPVVVASLAADHRASDGAIGARFLNRIDRMLQRPEEL